MPGAAFDQGAAPWLSDKVNEQVEQHRQDKADYQRQSQEVRGEGQRQIAEETTRVRNEQEGMQQEARSDVVTRREQWREEDNEIQEDFATKSEVKRKEVDERISTEVKTSEASRHRVNKRRNKSRAGARQG